MELTDILNRDIICPCGRTHRCDIRRLCIEEGALDRLSDLVTESHVLLVADTNTWAVCGEAVLSQLKHRVENRCIFQRQGHLVPNEESLEELRSHITEHTDLILGIGSGVINDLCKYVSWQKNLPCGIVATAPSMDGFASSGAAMILKGMKVTETTHAPDLILGDVTLLKQAPMNMIRSGYADIIGKYSALNDWKLSEQIYGEYLCPMVYDLVKEKTDAIRAAAKDLNQRDPEAIRRLTETLVLIGACLTLLSTTRPGSGSEHHLSHYFEITGLIEKKPYFLHGTDVGYSTIVTAGLREKICTVASPDFQSISKEAREACYRKIYKEFWPEVQALQQKAGRYDTPIYHRYREHWGDVIKILSECPTAAEIAEMLTDAGFDLSEFEALYGKERIERGIWFGKDLKDRYSVLWLYYDLFINESEAKNIYESKHL
ncbi:MAG: sn-glycerol-1-phosphate dehydrogenase [Clostridia bacterium]|nr:sn-glycerol-1-phosphate dehydrogenase [Clostridia bacterium]